MKTEDMRLGMPCLLISTRGNIRIKPVQSMCLNGSGEVDFQRFGVNAQVLFWNSEAVFDTAISRAIELAEAYAADENTTIKDKKASEDLIARYQTESEVVLNYLQEAANSCRAEDHFPLGSRLWYIDDVPKGRILTGVVSEIAYQTCSLAPYEGQWGLVRYKFKPVGDEVQNQYELYNTAHTDDFFETEKDARLELHKRFSDQTAGVLHSGKVTVLEAGQYH